MGWTSSMTRLCVYSFNGVFLLLGMGNIAVGIFLKLDKSKFMSIVGKIPDADAFDVKNVIYTTSYLENCAVIMIASGSFIFLVAFCGLYGTWKKKPYMLKLHIMLLATMIGVQFTAGILYFFYSDRVTLRLKSWLNSLIEDYYEGATLNGELLAMSTDKSGISDSIDLLQVTLKCCGVESYNVFNASTKWPGQYNITSGGNVTTVSAVAPLSCCKLANPAAWPGNFNSLQFVDLQQCVQHADSDSTNTEGCYGKVLALVALYSSYAFTLLGCVAGIEMLLIIASIGVIRRLPSDEEI